MLIPNIMNKYEILLPKYYYEFVFNYSKIVFDKYIHKKNLHLMVESTKQIYFYGKQIISV